MDEPFEMPEFGSAADADLVQHTLSQVMTAVWAIMAIPPGGLERVGEWVEHARVNDGETYTFVPLSLAAATAFREAVAAIHDQQQADDVAA